mmetsp:Transcript_14576/g.26146  ORF Transcript_14576/g.26146 Transcript_14576/m.26146 type:complete len:156 (+) Transcript_14576:127-594(+)
MIFRSWVALALCLALVMWSSPSSTLAARNTKLDDHEEISDLLKETEFVKMLEYSTAKHDKRLTELHKRLESELSRVNSHFEEMLEKIHESERNIEKNLARIEESVMGKVEDVKAKATESSGSWKWPFLILFIALLGLSGFFARLYRKATKHSHFL